MPSPYDNWEAKADFRPGLLMPFPVAEYFAAITGVYVLSPQERFSAARPPL